MLFHDWKEKFSHNHITDKMRELLGELKEIEQYEIDELKEDLRIRRDELIDFRDTVEDMLEAEWKWFLYQIHGYGGGHYY